MPDWNYGDAYIRHPCDGGKEIVFDDGSIVKPHDIFNPLPDFMKRADLIFTDSPWNQGNIRSFYTKAGIDQDGLNFDQFVKTLFVRISEIRPSICYLEIGKEYLPQYAMYMRCIYKNVTFYNSTYYHRSNNLCYVVRGSDKAAHPKLDGMDEEDIIRWVCENEKYTVIGDLCMGRGLVGKYAAEAGKRFVGTELNHKRLSVLLETLYNKGIKYKYIESR